MLLELIPMTAPFKPGRTLFDHFEDKFTLVYDLIKFKPFFFKCIKIALERCIAQNVYIVELRHITGNLYNEDKVRISLREELK